ncbi:cytochrome c553 [Bradyrhizobium sp. USDA 3650]
MRRQFISHAISAVALLALGSLPTSAADNAAIKEKAAVCAGCHGENGISQTENIPSLAGQPDQFLQWQLVFFRAGSRKNDQMQSIAEEITNEDVRNLGAYFAALTPPTAAEDKDPDLSKKGAQVAVGRRCASCHTDSFAWHQGGRAARGPARGIPGQGAARLQEQPARRRWRRRDGRCRLSHE